MSLDLGPYTFDAVDDTVDLPATGRGDQYTISVEGTSVQTLNFQDSFDGTNYAPLQLFDQTTTGATNLTAAKMWTTVGNEHARSFVRPRLRTTAFTSGSLTVRVRIIPARKYVQ